MSVNPLQSSVHVCVCFLCGTLSQRTLESLEQFKMMRIGSSPIYRKRSLPLICILPHSLATRDRERVAANFWKHLRNRAVRTVERYSAEIRVNLCP